MLWLRVRWPLAVLLAAWPGAAAAQAAAAAPSVAAADPDGARSLVIDTERVVAAEDTDGWFSDREAWVSIEGHLLQSVCRASVPAREGALATLRARHAKLGDPKALFAARGELSGEVEDALMAERELTALTRTVARQAECPFWVRAAPGFQGLQSDQHRITISVESGGNVQFRRTQGHWTFGGGGGGRLLFGWGFDGRFSLLLGPEFGGSALLRPNSNASELVINYFPAVPVLLRSRFSTWHLDFEMAPVALFEADNTRRSYGARVGGAFALTTLRRRNVLAWAGLAVFYEHYFAGGGREEIHFIRGGLRIGLPWDP